MEPEQRFCKTKNPYSVQNYNVGKWLEASSICLSKNKKKKNKNQWIARDEELLRNSSSSCELSCVKHARRNNSLLSN